MSSPNPRPLSPHLTIWRWGPGMLVSILHRVTGGAITVAGLAILAWWLAAIAGGDESYAKFTAIAGHPVGLIVLAGLNFVLFRFLGERDGEDASGSAKVMAVLSMVLWTGVLFAGRFIGFM